MDRTIKKMGKCSAIEKRIAKEAVVDRIFEERGRESFGWKHSAPPLDLLFEAEDVCIVFLVKNPYSWLLSLAQRPYHSFLSKPTTFSEFVVRPWVTVRRENAPALIENPVELWNFKLHSYFNTAAKIGHPVFFIKSEDLIQDQESAISPILELTGRKNEEFEPLIDATKTIDRDLGKDLDYFKDYYGERKWRHDLDPESIRRINEYLDPVLMENTGYEFISP